MMHKIKVEPIEGGWVLDPGGGHAGIVFRSGAKAERSARLLGQRLAEAGRASEVEIRLRDGALAGRITFTPDQHLDLAS